MKRCLCLLLIFMIFGISFLSPASASSGSSFFLVSMSVKNGDENISISPELVYSFSNELDEKSLCSISLNDDSSYIQSIELDEDKTGLAITLSKNLSYYSYYTIDFSSVKDINGVNLGEKITFRTKAMYENEFLIESSSLSDGDTDVSLNPELTFDFNHRILGEGFTPALNGDTSYIKSFSISEDDDTVLNILLAKELEGGTPYTLELQGLTDIYGNSCDEDISFTTKMDKCFYNVVTDDFQSSTSIDTDKWRKGGNGIAEIISSDGNNFLHLKGTASGHSQFDNYQKTVSRDMPGDVVFEFKAMFPQDAASYAGYRPYLQFYCNNKANSNLFRVKPNTSKTAFIMEFKSGTTYTEVATVGVGEWIKLSLVINTSRSTYELYINDTKFDAVFTLAEQTTKESIDYFCFKAHNGYEIYLDDLKIAQRLALVPNEQTGEYESFVNSGGSAISEIDPVKTTHKARIVNNGPADEAMHIFLALYDAETNELLELKEQSFTVKANSHYDITQSFDNLGTKARKCYIKAIYVNNENDITPYKSIMIPSFALVLGESTQSAK